MQMEERRESGESGGRFGEDAELAPIRYRRGYRRFRNERTKWKRGAKGNVKRPTGLHGLLMV